MSKSTKQQRTIPTIVDGPNIVPGNPLADLQMRSFPGGGLQAPYTRVPPESPLRGAYGDLGDPTRSDGGPKYQAGESTDAPFKFIPSKGGR